MRFFHSHRTYCTSRLASHSQRGFTLFEMIVSLAIFTILTTTVLVKHSKFRGDILLTSVANQVAVAIREQQVKSLSVTGAVAAGTSNYTFGQGLNFNRGTSTAYIQYTDRNNNNAYSAADTPMKTINLPKGMTISRFCAMPRNGSEQNNLCSDTGAVTQLNITFRRPTPEPIVTITGVAASVSDAIIYIQSSNKRTKAVKVNFLGQVSVI